MSARAISFDEKRGFSMNVSETVGEGAPIRRNEVLDSEMSRRIESIVKLAMAQIRRWGGKSWYLPSHKIDFEDLSLESILPEEREESEFRIEISRRECREVHEEIVPLEPLFPYLPEDLRDKGLLVEEAPPLKREREKTADELVFTSKVRKKEEKKSSNDWSIENDLLLFLGIYHFSGKAFEGLISGKPTKLDWYKISAICGFSQTGKQCKERFFNQLNPIRKHNEWSSKELQALVDAQFQSKYFNHWEKMSRQIEDLKGRTGNDIKQAWRNMCVIGVSDTGKQYKKCFQSSSDYVKNLLDVVRRIVGFCLAHRSEIIVIHEYFSNHRDIPNFDDFLAFFNRRLFLLSRS